MIHKDGIENNFVDWQDFSIDQTYQQHLKYIQKKRRADGFFSSKESVFVVKEKAKPTPE